ncbi:hypothetical protein [Burkholderia pseudomallei]|uniref:hypothetical protein n=1 Tax=Burkholderia pseudomallei TaxID=28450 RepID=UPI00014F9271|nr:glycosyltransferase [Burkholderia pseudomallei 305]
MCCPCHALHRSGPSCAGPGATRAARAAPGQRFVGSTSAGCAAGRRTGAAGRRHRRGLHAACRAARRARTGVRIALLRARSRRHRQSGRRHPNGDRSPYASRKFGSHSTSCSERIRRAASGVPRAACRVPRAAIAMATGGPRRAR